MAANKWWSRFGKNVGRECTGISGWVIGTGLGVGGLGLAITGPIGLGLAYMGGVGILGGLSTGIYQAWPPKLRTAADLNAQKVSIQEVLELEPPILKLGVVGDSEAGKTTLVNRLLQQPLPQQRTQGVGAYIAALQTTPPSYVALIDGGGEEFAQQFLVAEHADALCIVLDHSRSHDNPTIDTDRLKDGQEFQRQLLGYIKGARTGEKPTVWLMINKRDLWERLDEQAQQPLHDAVKTIRKDWERSNLTKDIMVSNHSNMIGDDVASFHTRIASLQVKSPT